MSHLDKDPDFSADSTARVDRMSRQTNISFGKSIPTEFLFGDFTKKDAGMKEQIGTIASDCVVEVM